MGGVIGQPAFSRECRHMRYVASTALVVFCAILVLLPSVSASTLNTGRVITIRAPFAGHGGLNETGSLTNANRGLGVGGSSITVAPSFNTTSGHIGSGQGSTSVQGGTKAFETWAGVYNLTFACGRRCASGLHLSELTWNLSWTGYARGNCSGYYSSGTWARLSASVFASVYDITSGRHALVGTIQSTAFQYELSAPHPWIGLYGSVNGTKAVRLGMNLSLLSGDSYEVETLVFLHTWAHSKLGCGVNSDATISYNSSRPASIAVA